MGNITNTVLTSKDQGLTRGQQKNARENIDAMGKLSKWRYGDVIVSGDGGEVIDSGIRLSPDGKIFAQSDWNETDPDNPAYIINKPDLDVYATKAEVATKAEKVYVDTELAKKADKTEISSKLEKVFVSNGDEPPTELPFNASNKSVTIPLAAPGADEYTWGISGLVKGTAKTFR